MASTAAREGSTDWERSANNERKPSLASWPSSESRSSTSSSGGARPSRAIPIVSPQVSSPPSSVDTSPKHFEDNDHGVFCNQSSQKLDSRLNGDYASEDGLDLARTPTNPFPEYTYDDDAHTESLPPLAAQANTASKSNDRTKGTATNIWQTDDLLSPLATTSPNHGGQSPSFAPSAKREGSVRGSPRRQTQRSASWKQGDVIRDSSGSISSGTGGLSDRQTNVASTSSPRSLNSQALPYTPTAFLPRSDAHSLPEQHGEIAKGSYGVVRGIGEAAQGEPRDADVYRRGSISSVTSASSYRSHIGAVTGHEEEDVDYEKDAVPELPSFSSPTTSPALNSAAPAFSPLSSLHNSSTSGSTTASFPFGSLPTRKNSLPLASYGLATNPGVDGQQTSSGTLRPHVEPFSPSPSIGQASSLGLSNVALPSSLSGRFSRSQSVTAISPSAPLGTASNWQTSKVHQRDYTSESSLADSAGANSVDTGYAASQTRRAYQQQYKGQPRGLADLAFEGPTSGAVESAESARQRSWSETGALGIISGQSDMAGSYGSQTRQMPNAGYSGSRGYARDGSDAMTPMSASLSSRYGHSYSLQSGPPSISDGSTDRGMGPEEINTIFVVGFPEDIQEREFVNMFIFAKGFEAATLKIPASTAAARERDAAAAAAVSAIAATLPVFPGPAAAQQPEGYAYSGSGYANNSYEPSVYDEGYRGSVSSASGPAAAVAEGAKRVSTALAAAALSASASSASLPSLSNNSYHGYPGGAAGKKQIIGFAKFRTREDAMEARDALSGRRIDAERNSILKAEMAKKNLHIKRGPNDPLGVALMTAAGPDYCSMPNSARGSSSALDRLAEQDREWRARMAAKEAQQAAMLEAGPHSHGPNMHSQAAQAGSASLDDEAAWSAFHSVPAATGQNTASFDHGSARESPENETGYLGLAIDRTPSAARARSSTSASVNCHPISGVSPLPLGGGKTLLQQLDEQEDVELPEPSDLSNSTADFGKNTPMGQFQSSGIVRRNPPAPLPTASLGGHTYIDQDFQNLALSFSLGPQSPRTLGAPAASYGATGPSSDTPTSAVPLSVAQQQRAYGFALPTSPSFADFKMPRHGGPGARADDNNMPISTLYVGGLPSSLPSVTSPISPGQLEETLRHVFSTCPGFKRLSFRQKSQGPMCFVEFEDVSHAARALKEMYGHTLGGLVKGGIRLAYSKNPLGIRGGPGSPATPHSPYFASDMFGALASPGGYGAAASTPTMTATMQQIQDLHMQQLQLQQRQQQQMQQSQNQNQFAGWAGFDQQQSRPAASNSSFSPFGN